MIFNLNHKADWEDIKQRKQKLINKNNQYENKKRIKHTYKKRDKVLLRRGTEHKMEVPFAELYEITQVSDNGTVRMKIDSATDTYNIRRLKPYKE